MIGNEVARIVRKAEQAIRHEEHALIATVHRIRGHTGRWRRCKACRSGAELRNASAGLQPGLSEA